MQQHLLFMLDKKQTLAGRQCGLLFTVSDSKGVQYKYEKIISTNPQNELTTVH